MTLTHHFDAYTRLRRFVVLDWKRFELAWEHYAPLHRLTPDKWTQQATDAISDRLLESMSPGTIRRDLACLGAFAHWLVKQGAMPAVPPWTVPQAPPPRERYLTPDEMRKILAIPAPDWFKRATRICMLTAQRIDAVLSLRWTQIHSGVVDFTMGTTARMKGRGVAPVTDSLAAILAGPREHPDFVVSHKWRRVTYQQYLREWRRVCKAAGVVGATPHCIRHGVATALVADGVPLIEVSKMLGHKSSTLTQKVYAKFAPDYTRRAVERMGGMLG